ncbi:DUF3850 domain-containing protein [Pantoea sp. JGM49]|uniref:DUF3850 domain-containing protein n=1 Tax=Pantoea sp. JGM49 TaxID=2799791 RepID=UPI001BADA882|nr:DUF3850 domain-containing protein [Pantoea sp. JGM49]MBS0880165.1 DUF3850 domain-containing protein [Pantoea sp. JGM49]
MTSFHFLKIWPDYYQDVISGMKRAELRKNDRNYSVGDSLILKEYRPKTRKFTGLEAHVLVTHITDVSEWLPGYVMLSIERLCWSRQ